MKFSLLAITTAAGAVASTNAKAFSITSSSITPSSRKMYYDDYFTKREDITGDNVFVFEACYEVTTAQSDNLDDTIIQAIKDGNARTGASYATFFTTPSMSDENRMVTSIGDYVAGKVKAAALAESWKCNQCTQYQDYCEDMLNRNSPDWYEQVNNGGGNRRNLSFRGPNCSSCAKCYSENYQADATKTTVANFVDDIANCYNTGYQDENGYNYYVGFACGSSGDTAEIATFLDADCFVQSTFSAYTALTANGSTYGDYSTKQVISYLKPYLADAMTTTTKCYSPVYDDPEMWDQELGDDMYAYSDNQAYVDQDYSQASKECHLIAGRAVYVNECEVNNDDQALEEAYAEQYDTTWYEVDVQNPEDEVEVCAVINAKLSNNKRADWDYFYNEKESGSMYDRDWLGRVIASSSNKMMSGASIFLIVVLVLGAVIVAPVVWRMKKKRDKVNARNGSLVEPIGGALA